jgi:hypothetical protein
MEVDFKTMIAERNAALLSLDEQKIRAYAKKYGARFPGSNDPVVFWGAVHKARTAIPSLPAEAKKESKQWLTKHGMSAWDDGSG